MAGAGGEEVGRISIRVVPDLDKFREKLRTGLAAIENTERCKIKVEVVGLEKAKSEVAAAAKDVKATVKTTADTKGVRAKIEAAAKDTVAKIKVEVDQTTYDRFEKRLKALSESRVSKYDPEFELTVKDEKLRRKVEDKLKELKDLASLPISLDPRIHVKDKLYLRQQFDEIDNTLKKHAAASQLGKWFDGPSADALARSSQFNDQLRTAIRLQNDAAQAQLRQQSIAEARDDITNMVRRTDELHKHYEESQKIKQSLAQINKLKNAPSALDLLDVDILGNTEKRLAKMDEATRRMKALKSFVPNFGTGVNPAGYAAIIGAITLVAAPLMGLITAALLAMPGMIALVATPIAAITLGLDGFKEAASTVSEPFQKLRDVMNEANKTAFTPMFTQLAQLFPSLEATMPKVSQGLADIGKSVADFLTDSVGKTRIEETIKNVGAALSQAAPGMTDFVDGFTQLAHQLSLKFPDIIDWFNGAGESFKNWVRELTDSGDLSEGFDRLGQVLREILETIGQLAVDGFEFLSDPGKVDGFVASLKGLLGVVKDLSNVSKELGPVWDGLKVLIKSLKIGDALLSGNPRDIAEATGLDPFGLLPKKAEEAGKNASDSFKEGWLGGGGGFGGGSDITGAIQDQLETVTTASVEAQKEALASAFNGTAVSDAVRGQIGMQLQSVIQEVQGQMQTLGPALDTAINSAVAPLQNMPGKVSESFASMSDAVTGAFGLLVLAIGTQAQNIPTAVGQAFDGIPQVISQKLGTAIQTAATGANQIVTAFTTSLANLSQVTLLTFNNLTQIVSTAMGDMVAKVTESGEQIGAAVRGWAGIISEAGAALAAVARSSGISIGSEFAAGISSMQGAVSAAVAGLMTGARAFFPNSPAKTGPFSGSGWIDKSGEAIVDGFAGGIENASSRVVGTVRELMQAIKDIFGSADGLTLNFNFGSVQDQMSSIAGSSKSFADNMSSSLGSVKPGKIDAGTRQTLDQLKLEQERLDVATAELKVQKGMVGDKGQKAAIQQQMDQIALQKQQLQMQYKQLEYQGKYESSVGASNEEWTGILQKHGQSLFDTGTNIMSGFASDLGISGNGALSTLAQTGMQWGSQFIFNVANMDDAIAGQQAQQNKQALGKL